MARLNTEETFKESWQQCTTEALYTHWTPGEPKNQIQLAFRNHWTLFQETMQNNPAFNQGKRCLEVGCGRGSLSAYFSEAGYDCTMLDISQTVIAIAQRIFSHNGLSARFITGDAKEMPLADNSFDIVFSIGLFEHFEDPAPFVTEQLRILDEGGMFFGYIVPQYIDNVQKDFAWVNDVLKGYGQQSGIQTQKPAVYRSDAGSERYIPFLEQYGLKDIQSSGVYPLPMISHAIDFPFSLMPPASEQVLVERFKRQLSERRREAGHHPWLCREGYGQAFLVWGTK